MSLNFELRVNGRVIGAFDAVNTQLSADPAAQIYQCHVRTIVNQATGEINGYDRQVTHDPNDGAWELVRKALKEASHAE